MIKQHTAYKLRANDERESNGIFYSLYHPENHAVKASVLVLHGMKEHSGRYDELARYLARQGFAVMLYDHLGHGKSIEKESDLGFFHACKPDTQVVNDAKTMAEYLQTLYEEAPHFVLGHSMGSFVARRLLAESGNSMDGAILVGTGGTLKGLAVLKASSSLLNKMMPRNRSVFNKLFDLVNNRRFRKEKSDTAWLSVNQANRDAFNNDKLCGIPFSNNGFYTLFSLYANATKQTWADTIPKGLPILFISGEQDPIGNFGQGIKQTVNDLKADGFEQISSKLYPGMRHEILNETGRTEVYEDISQWLETRLTAQ